VLRSNRHEGQSEYTSEVFAQAQGIVERRVDVAAGDGIAHPEQLEAAVRVVDLVLRATALALVLGGIWLSERGKAP
jgi:hypothetical protein